MNRERSFFGPLQVADAEVLVVTASLDVSAASLERLWSFLSSDERSRARRFRLAVHQDRFVAARGLLREMVGTLLDTAPRRVAFEYGSREKPRLARACAAVDLRFNVSHAEGLAVYAVALGREVGIDVEPVRPLPDAERIAERFFSPREREALRSLAASERLEAFFACWTRKEAFLKATGEGLSRALDSFDVSVRPFERPRLLRAAGDPLAPQRWSLEEIRPAPGFVGAVAFAGRGRLSCDEWAQGPPGSRLDARDERAAQV